MVFNIDDPFQVHAYFMVGFWCSACGAGLSLRSEAEVLSDEWCVEVADEAKSSGWHVPAPSPEGDMDVATCFCPRCAANHEI